MKLETFVFTAVYILALIVGALDLFLWRP